MIQRFRFLVNDPAIPGVLTLASGVAIVFRGGHAGRRQPVERVMKRRYHIAFTRLT